MQNTRSTFSVPAVFLGVAAVAVTGCATFGGANYVSVEEEWELGRQIEADLAGRLELVDDATIQRYVNEMGQRMVRRTELGELPWRFHVVADPEINAFNVPGGLVYVHTGLLEKAGSAAEFAGALAHEIGHGVARHGTERLSKAQEANLVASILLGENPGAVAEIGAQVAAAGAFASFSRQDEREADEIAVPMMAGVGYDPEGMARLLRRIMESGAGGGGFFASHPNPEERIQNVRELSGELDRSGLRMDDNAFSTIRSRAARYH